eukprot:scaffold4886_cov123-Isochrysis_galbana.AAC.1
MAFFLKHSGDVVMMMVSSKLRCAGPMGRREVVRGHARQRPLTASQRGAQLSADLKHRLIEGWCDVHVALARSSRVSRQENCRLKHSSRLALRSQVSDIRHRWSWSGARGSFFGSPCCPALGRAGVSATTGHPWPCRFISVGTKAAKERLGGDLARPKCEFFC